MIKYKMAFINTSQAYLFNFLIMKILITGGAGFIGINLAKKMLKMGENVIVIDNFFRSGTLENIKWLEKQKLPGKLTIITLDLRIDWQRLKEIIDSYQVDALYHLAGQVAVTTSVTNPREDFEINALGTFNVLEAIRLSKRKPLIIYTSTNKVFGGMEDVEIVEREKDYIYKDFPLGIPEDRLLDFHSPYGCSKGAADQYVRDYGRIYSLKTVVFRQSAIYGPHQMGVEDQGWVAWFTIAAICDKKITIYGNGKQVRDVLFIDDLVKAFRSATDNINRTAGQIFNIGGGPNFKMSLLECLDMLEKLLGKKIELTFDKCRPGDQPVYISDIRKAKAEFGWEPAIGPQEGVKRLFEWVFANKDLFKYIEHKPVFKK